MKPTINNTAFGTIDVEGTTYDNDIIIRSNGEVKKRKKKLSRAIYGTSHTVSLDEMVYTYEKGVKKIIIGNGQYGVLKLSDNATQFLQERNCKILICKTPDAIKLWNQEKGKAIGLFHITC